MGQEQNAYDRAKEYIKRTKVVQKGELWFATATQVIFEIKHGYVVFQLKGPRHDEGNKRDST